MSGLHASVLAVALTTAAIAPSVAQDLMYSPNPIADVVSELRIGGHIHDVHYAMLPFLVNEWEYDNIGDVSFDVLFRTPDLDAFRWIGSPRPEIGATISLNGYESLAHLGLTWQLPVFDTPLYLEGTFGAAINSGYLHNAPVGYSSFGCRVNFYERFGVGAHVSDNVTATLTYEHTSNAGLCGDNAGLSNVGLRLGWKF